MRAGMHTGTVLLGGGVDAEGSIRGATVNVAARMEQSAPPGCLRISHDSYRHVRGMFEVVEQAPIQVKGIEQPLRSYLVERARPRAFRVPRAASRACTPAWSAATPSLGRASRQFAAPAATRGRRAHDRRRGRASARAGCWPSSTLGLGEACWMLLGRRPPAQRAQPVRAAARHAGAAVADRRDRPG